MAQSRDVQLLGSIKAKDSTALRDLMSTYEAALRNHVARVTGDAGAAEDIVQEVFLKVWTRAEQYSGRGSVKSWLYTIASNMAKNHLRGISRRREVCLDGSDENNDVVWTADKATHSPEVFIELLEKEQMLARLISNLPDGKREVVQLVAEYELAPKEIAAVLGLPPGTVRSRLYHVRRTFVPLLTDYDITEV